MVNRADARQATSRRCAYPTCSVLMWPWWMDFSRRACSEMRLMGRSTLMRRLEFIMQNDEPRMQN